MIEFIKKDLTAGFLDASGRPVQRQIQVRTDPVTRVRSRVTLARALENETGTRQLHHPPREDLNEAKCPFCTANLDAMTPCLAPEISRSRRLVYNQSVLFPNLYPYTEWSGVSLFGSSHYVEIGRENPDRYGDSLINCARYLERVRGVDPDAVYMSITQNHLPGAGGSLIHPHLQVHATREISNAHQVLEHCTHSRGASPGGGIFADLIQAEKQARDRYLGATGSWEWVAAFAPSGFYEIWGISMRETSLLISKKTQVWQELARGVLNTQKFYKSLNRNAYNLTLISIEAGGPGPCLRVCLAARSNYAPWVRNDITGFEKASGEMATFTLPEETAAKARPFWK